jgi:retron-type reverse transcriptase
VQSALTVPRIADRVVMTAAVTVLAPIFEVDMPAEQHAYRANFSAHTAVRSVHSLINTGHTQIVEGDLAGYLDSSSQYTSSCFSGIEQIGKSLRYLNS